MLVTEKEKEKKKLLPVQQNKPANNETKTTSGFTSNSKSNDEKYDLTDMTKGICRGLTSKPFDLIKKRKKRKEKRIRRK